MDLSMDPNSKVLVSKAQSHVNLLGFRLAEAVDFSNILEAADYDKVQLEIRHKCKDAQRSFAAILCQLIGLSGRVHCLVDPDTFDFMTTSGLVLEGQNEFIVYGVFFDHKSQRWSTHS